MISKDILKDIDKHSECGVLLTIYRCAGQSGRAFPSLRRLAGILKAQDTDSPAMSKSTVCRALKELQRKQAIVRSQCRTRNGCYAANSYYVTNLVTSDPLRHTSCEGGTIIGKPISINQITEDYTMREKKSFGSYFGSAVLYTAADPFYSGMWFDGVGVRVSTDGEPFITG